MKHSEREERELSGIESGTPALAISGLEAWYGESHILHGVDLTVHRGEVVTLLGRNGMGKTTTLKVLFNLLPAWRGEIRFRGERINGRSTERIAQMGIALVPEGRQIFPNLTVRENLTAFAGNRSGSADPWNLDRIHALFTS